MTFSVIIPCFNHAHFLEESLSSLLNQSYTYWEAIIVNDGSTDNTVEVVNTWCKKDKRIKLISTSNLGLSYARNIGMNISFGDYISFLDADDKYAPNHLESILKSLKKDLDVVFTGYTYFSSTSFVNHTVTLNKNIQFNEILHGNIVPPVAVAFKRHLLLQSDIFDTSLKSAEDWDLWIRFYKIGAKLGILEESSCFYRIAENSMSRQFLTMYDALKIVSIRAYKFDYRISKANILNRNIVEHHCESIKKHLLLCLGVAIVQNKQTLALDLFRKEMLIFKFIFKISDFKFMCSYLSFRYQVSNNDIDWVFNILYPRFSHFLDIINIPGLDKKYLMNEIFSVHKKKRIKQQWGFLSPLINLISCT